MELIITSMLKLLKPKKEIKEEEMSICSLCEYELYEWGLGDPPECRHSSNLTKKDPHNGHRSTKKPLEKLNKKGNCLNFKQRK